MTKIQEVVEQFSKSIQEDGHCYIAIVKEKNGPIQVFTDIEGEDLNKTISAAAFLTRTQTKKMMNFKHEQSKKD